MFGTLKRLIASSTIAVVPADFQTSARNANALPPSNLIRVAVSSAESPLISWARSQDLRVHGWVYSLANGLVKDLEVAIGRPKEIERLD